MQDGVPLDDLEHNRRLIDADVREAFDHMWHDGYDGKELAMSFVRVASRVVREENPDDIAELRHQLD